MDKMDNRPLPLRGPGPVRTPNAVQACSGTTSAVQAGSGTPSVVQACSGGQGP